MTSVAAELEGFRALSCALRLWELCKELFCFECFFANWRGLEHKASDSGHRWVCWCFI